MTGYVKLMRVHLKNWNLEFSGNKGLLKYKGDIVYVFPTTWSQKFKLFEYLFEHNGVRCSYEELYEHSSERPYPEQGKRAKLNQLLQRQVNMLKKDLGNLPIHISTYIGEQMSIKDNWK